MIIEVIMSSTEVRLQIAKCANLHHSQDIRPRIAAPAGRFRPLSCDFIPSNREQLSVFEYFKHSLHRRYPCSGRKILELSLGSLLKVPAVGKAICLTGFKAARTETTYSFWLRMALDVKGMLSNIISVAGETDRCE